MSPEMVCAFRRVGLGLKVLEGPIRPRSRGIFQMDIYRARSGEYFRLWPGARDNDFGLLDADADFRQVVLRVREPRRRFEEVVWRRSWRGRAEVERSLQGTDGRIARETKLYWLVERWTPEEERRYLCGFDEHTLFIAQVRAGDTVWQAHESLRPAEVRRAESGWPGAVVRQGEWFFLPALPEEIDRMEAYASSHRRSVRQAEPVGPGAQPHVADHLVRVDRRERRHGRERRHLDVYVRGRVRHADHRDVRLDDWRRVVRNAAVVPAVPDRERVRWID
jgi:hypothetical protein